MIRSAFERRWRVVGREDGVGERGLRRAGWRAIVEVLVPVTPFGL